MLNQDSREILYFKVPVFFTDMGIHVGVLFFLLSRTLDFHLDSPKSVYMLLAIAFTLSICLCGLKLHERHIKLLKVLWRAFKQTAICSLFFAAQLIMTGNFIPRNLIFCEFLCSMILITLWHFVANKMVRLLRRLGRNIRHVVIIGADENALKLYDELIYGQVYTGYKVEGFFSSLQSISLPKNSTYLGTVDESYGWIEKNRPDEVYCSLPPINCQKEVNLIIRKCNELFVDFFFVPTMEGYPKRQMSIKQFGRVTIMNLREEPLNSPLNSLMKRSFDILVSSFFLLSVFPFVFLFVYFGNFLFHNKGPIFFRQARTGYSGKSFQIFKFRSMKVNDDADRLQATEDDPRKTKFGDFLRRSSIDELPQFINVLKGEMSIIGPRPHMEFHTELYSGLISDYMVRHLVKPGITGWAQINGCRGETKTVDDMKKRVDHDIWYIEHWTPLLDVEIFLKTFWQCLPGNDKQAY